MKPHLGVMPVTSDARIVLTEPLTATLAALTITCDGSVEREEVVAKVKSSLLDMIGCAFAGGNLPWSQAAIRFASVAARGSSTLIGSSVRTSVTEAAFANGVLAHSLLQEEIHPSSYCHLGVVIFPALLALAEHENSSGEDLIASAVIGYEIGGRFGRAVMRGAAAPRFRPTGIIGPIAGAAAAARLLRLDREQTASAIAFAANTSAGLNEWARTGGWEVFFHAGIAARSALTAALLARDGGSRRNCRPGYDRRHDL